MNWSWNWSWKCCSPETNYEKNHPFGIIRCRYFNLRYQIDIPISMYMYLNHIIFPFSHPYQSLKQFDAIISKWQVKINHFNGTFAKNWRWNIFLRKPTMIHILHNLDRTKIWCRYVNHKMHKILATLIILLYIKHIEYSRMISFVKKRRKGLASIHQIFLLSSSPLSSTW